MSPPYVCASCRHSALQISRTKAPALTPNRLYHRPSFAPKPTLDLKHIRQSPGLYEQNCLDRNYPAQARNGWKILELHEQIVQRQRAAVELRQRNNVVGKEIQAQQVGGRGDGHGDAKLGIAALVEEAKELKRDLAELEGWEEGLKARMEGLALELPNLSSQSTPLGKEGLVVDWINGSAPPNLGASGGKSHVEIGRELDLIDFEASAATSGWGWYFLKNEGALLEQALVQLALDVALRRGWRVMTPPSLVYGHVASACGFMPRDQNGGTQVYIIANDDPEKAGMVLTGTAEIPFAGSQASKTLTSSDLPLKVIGPSRCYRAEAGARGVDTKGLYRVHEFTKVEMFAWTQPPSTHSGDRFGASDEEDSSQSDIIFAEMLAIQTEILQSLGLHARVLEMPSTDLGASASRKIDIEAFFPSRTAIDDGYGEVTSASVCTDYQARRLGTRVRMPGGGKPGWAWTLNGTAMAVPRVLAAVIENGWDAQRGVVTVPEALRKFMLGGVEEIGPRKEKSR